MSLRYIFGGAGSGKTSLCLEEITRRASDGTNNALIFIVPEQFTMQSEKDLMALSENNALIYPQVLSFRRLAYRLFSESGGAKGKILDDVGKSMLIRKILNEQREGLLFFKKSADKQGLVDNLGAVFSEFSRQNIMPKDLLKNSEKNSGGEERRLAHKLKDLHSIYAAYMDYIEKNYISPDTELSYAPEKIADSEFLTGAEVWIDAFNGFTAQEYKIIEALLKKVDRVSLTLTIKGKAISYGDINYIDPFYEVKRTMNKLTSICSEVKIDPPTVLTTCHRLAPSPQLAFLEQNYLNRTGVYNDDGENILMLKAANKYSETEWLCGKIIELVRDESYRYGQIAVVCAAVPDYERIIRDAFGRYEIPLFIDSKSDILTHPLTAAIRSVIDAAAYNRNFESIFGFLKTGMTTLLRDEIDVLENYALAYGIKGYKWDFEKWEAGLSGEKGELINDYMRRAKECFQPFTEGLSPSRRYAVKELTKRIFLTLKKLNADKTLEIMADNAIAAGDYEAARGHRQVWNMVLGVLEKTVELIGDEQVRVEEFGRIIEAGFRACDLAKIPPAQDQVMVGDLERTRLHKIKALFVIGINEGVLPRTAKDEGLISDDERRQLKDAGLDLQSGGLEKSFLEHFLIYSLITKPSRRLFLSWPTGNLDGKAIKPSSMIQRIKKMFPNIREEEPDRPITLPEAMFQDMGILLREFLTGGREMSPVEKNLYNWYLNDKGYLARIRVMEKMLTQQNQQEKLSGTSVQKLYGDEFQTSISRLEKYVQCPFAYYVQYDLGARERKIYEVRPVDVGNLFHAILESFMTMLAEDGIAFRDVTEEEISVYVDACIEKLSSVGGEVLTGTSKDRYMLGSVGRMAKKSIWALKEHIRRGDFEPLGAEMAFKTDSAVTGIVMAVNGGRKLVLSGKIDRVDVMDQGNNKYIKIIDYKTGDNKFDLDDVYFGMQLQLVTYMDAFIKNGARMFGKENLSGSILPGGIFYFNIKDPLLDYDGESDQEKLNDLFLKEFKMSGLVLSDESVVKSMDCDIKGQSNIIPVYLSKNGFGKKSSVVGEEEFEEIRNRVTEKTVAIANEIIDGGRNILPYKKDSLTGCKFCSYNVVCGFDGIEDKKYNRVK